MLLRCCLLYINNYTKTLVIFTIWLDLQLFLLCLWDLFFIFIIIFTMINHIFIMMVIYNEFQQFWGSKLLSGCFSSLMNVCKECNNFQNSRHVYDQWFKSFPKNSFETAEFWCIVNLRTILCLLQRKNSTFP